MKLTEINPNTSLRAKKTKEIISKWSEYFSILSFLLTVTAAVG